MHLEHVKDKVQQTSLRKYGTKNPSSSAEVKSKRTKTVQRKYGVDNVWKVPAVLDKSRKTMIAKYGVRHSSHILIGADTIEKLLNKQWCEEYLKSHDIGNLMSELNISRSIAIKYLKQHNLIDLSKSYFEAEMRSFLQSIGVTNFLERSKKIIPPLELDFVIGNVAIECNGAYWHSELNSKDKTYHLNKTNRCKEKGIHLLHVWDYEWRDNPELVKERIKSKLLKSTSITYARKTKVVEVSFQEASKFLNKHHLQKSCPSLIQYGLEYCGNLVALMTFGRSRFDKTVEYELLRYCSTGNVPGGASKLFAHFIKLMAPNSVISYSDKSWNSGALYTKLGFEFVRSTAPAYKYTSDYLTFENRIAFQKHKLKSKLEKFNPALTEWENMQANGYDRIWDCGTDVFLWVKSS
jgi:hypothetical protein